MQKYACRRERTIGSSVKCFFSLACLPACCFFPFFSRLPRSLLVKHCTHQNRLRHTKAHFASLPWAQMAGTPPDESQSPEDSVDITISNVVSHFSVRCHLNLRTIATNGSNVVYQREQSVSGVCVCDDARCFVLFLPVVPFSRIFRCDENAGGGAVSGFLICCSTNAFCFCCKL